MEKKIRISLGVILAFVALGAIPAGLALILKPDGSNLGWTVEPLKGSLFKDYLVPGIFLLSINGLLSLTGAIFCFTKNGLSAITGLLLGVFLVAWICIQVIVVGLISWMQYFFFFVGIIEIVLSIFLKRQKKVTPDKILKL
jgi:hypothetical protein